MSINTPDKMGEQLEEEKDQPEQLQQEPLKVKPKRYKSFKYILAVIINVCLSAFYFGYMIIYLSVIDFGAIMKVFSIDMDPAIAEGLLTFCVPLGGLFGSYFSSFFISRLSRRQTLLYINAAAFALGILLYFAQFKFYMLIRFGQGMCAGIFSAVVPLIIKEIAPFELSGFFGVFQQLFITAGIFFGSILVFILTSITDDKTGISFWRITFGVPLITITIQTILLNTLFKFQTPKYLLNKNREQQARQLIQKIYFEEYVDDVLKEYRDQDGSCDSDEQGPQVDLKLPKKVSVHLALLQQMVGISAVTTYGRQLAERSLHSLKPVLPSILGFEQVFFSFLSAFLLSKYGRKTILQMGTIGAAVSNVVIALGFWLDEEHPTLSLVLILMALFYYMANFNLSLGPIVWMYIPQIVDPDFLPFSTMVNWGGSALSILLFPIIKDHLPGNNPAPMFMFFAIWSVMAVVVNSRYIVETKEKTTAQIRGAYICLENK